MISRRRFLTGVAIGLAPIGAPAHAQEYKAQQAGKVWRIGFMNATPLTNPAAAENWEAFRLALQKHGYVEGRNVVFERRFSEGQDARFPALVSELVSLNVDALVTGTGPSVNAAKEATSTIPIVIAAVSDPVGRGLVNSLARPGGNITGVADYQSDLNPKRLELLKAAVPKAAHVVVVTNAAGWEPAKRATQQTDLDVAAQGMGITLLRVVLNAPVEFNSVTATIVRGHPDALLINPVPITFQLHKELAEFAAKQRLPAMAGNRSHALAGILMSYGPSVPEMYRRAADYVAKILRGAKPADLPIEQPTKFDLVINLKTAKALGLTIPPSLLGRADEVIQ